MSVTKMGQLKTKSENLRLCLIGENGMISVKIKKNTKNMIKILKRNSECEIRIMKIENKMRMNSNSVI